MKAADAPLAHRIITLALQATKADTMRGIYERIAPGSDGRIRTVLSPVGTETGRFSSSDSFLEPSTNLQNLPKKAALLDPLYEVRSAIIAAPGHVLIEADLSQAEARATAAYCRDTALLEMFSSGRDVYKYTIALMEGIDESEVTKEQRIIGKFSRLSGCYGIGWQEYMTKFNKDADITGLAISAAKAKWCIDRLRETNPKLTEWWAEVWDEAQTNGYLTNAYGRRRHFLSKYLRQTDVIASNPQSTIADHVNVGLVKARAAGLPIALQVHDAVVLEVPVSDAAAAAAQLHTVMCFPVRIGDIELSLPVEVSMGERWSEMEGVELEQPLRAAA